MTMMLPLQCPECKFRTREKDIELYSHMVEQHAIPHASAQVIYCDAIRRTYPIQRWRERLEHATSREDQQDPQSIDAKLQNYLLSVDEEKGK